jgi:hypothetical protein
LSGLDALIPGNDSQYFGDRPVEGVVTRAPTSPTDLLDVAIPSFDSQQGFNEFRWMPRGSDLPTVGARCLVIFTSTGDGWVVAWWPT